MSLLEDARRLAAAGSYDDGGNGSYNEPACIHCLAFPEDEHKLDCPWLAMPRIVAALEAAEKTLHSLEHFPLREIHVRTGYARHVLDGITWELQAALGKGR